MADSLCSNASMTLDAMTHSGFNDPLSVSTSVAPNFLQPTLPTFAGYLHMSALFHMSKTELFTSSTKRALLLVGLIPNQNVFSDSFLSLASPYPTQIGDGASIASLPSVLSILKSLIPFWPPDLSIWMLK